MEKRSEVVGGSLDRMDRVSQVGRGALNLRAWGEGKGRYGVRARGRDRGKWEAGETRNMPVTL